MRTSPAAQLNILMTPLFHTVVVTREKCINNPIPSMKPHHESRIIPPKKKKHINNQSIRKHAKFNSKNKLPPPHRRRPLHSHIPTPCFFVSF